jgi:riboflavin synthase
MFTGIVEETGRIESIETRSHGIHLVLRAKTVASDLKIGDSLAVNGCCLTVVQLRRRRGGSAELHFDLLQETWNRTNLSRAPAHGRVNLERALRADARLSGHFVTGHIDGMGRITRWEPVQADHLLEIEAPAAIARYLIPKGSIAVDGISLTIAEVLRRRFRLWIIPHTLAVTSLQDRHVGDQVNLEADVLGKYVDRLRPRAAEPTPKSRASRHR